MHRNSQMITSKELSFHPKATVCTTAAAAAIFDACILRQQKWKLMIHSSDSNHTLMEYIFTL